MNRLEKYAVGQHALACDDLGVGKSPDGPGPSLHEAVCELKEAAADLAKYTEQMLEQTAEWNAAVEKVIGRQPKTGIATQGPILAARRVRHLLSPNVKMSHPADE